jgi:hypothetical protein
MSSVFKTLTSITIWVLFVSGLIFLILPIVLGIATGALAGTINSVDDGLLWFWRHGFSFLLSVIFLTASVFVVKVRKKLE